jgi:hypothetical protein
MKNCYLTTHSGIRFDILRPDPDMIDLQDIAYQLSRIPRYNASSEPIWTVAQHSILLTYIVPNPYKPWALFHDSAEAYIGDIYTDLKQLFPELKQIEHNILEKVAQKFGLSFDPEIVYPQLVHDLDYQLFVNEARSIHPRCLDHIAGVQRVAFLYQLEDMMHELLKLSPEQVELCFLQTWEIFEKERLNPSSDYWTTVWDTPVRN